MTYGLSRHRLPPIHRKPPRFPQPAPSPRPLAAAPGEHRPIPVLLRWPPARAQAFVDRERQREPGRLIESRLAGGDWLARASGRRSPGTAPPRIGLGVESRRFDLLHRQRRPRIADRANPVAVGEHFGDVASRDPGPLHAGSAGTHGVVDSDGVARRSWPTRAYSAACRYNL